MKVEVVRAVETEEEEREAVKEAVVTVVAEMVEVKEEAAKEEAAKEEAMVVKWAEHMVEQLVVVMEEAIVG